jgi:hypothetical protein
MTDFEGTQVQKWVQSMSMIVPGPAAKTLLRSRELAEAH